jgi:outer membrane protein
MKKMTLSTLPAALVTLTAASLCHPITARADDVPANSVRVGMYFIFYHVTATDLQGPYVPPGVNFNLKDAQTAYFGYIRRLNSFLDVELALGVPPNTKTLGRGPATVGSVPFNGQTIATAKWLAPSALLEYRFLPESSVFQPYIGAGINYTSFYDRQVTTVGQESSGGPTRLSLTSSVGPVGTVGCKYSINTHWHVNLSYSISSVDSNIKLDTEGEIRTARIHFGPQALVVSAGYSF